MYSIERIVVSISRQRKEVFGQGLVTRGNLIPLVISFVGSSLKFFCLIVISRRFLRMLARILLFSRRKGGNLKWSDGCSCSPPLQLKMHLHMSRGQLLPLLSK